MNETAPWWQWITKRPIQDFSQAAATRCGIAVLLLFSGLGTAKAQTENDKPRIMLINSYHPNYEWSAGIIQGAMNELEMADPENSLAELKVHHMDTKRNIGESFIESAALEAKTRIEEWDPDVIITADDNAFGYLVMQHYKNAERPVVFCGVNWDVSHYDGAPYTNTTGMIEVALFKPLYKHLRKYAVGNRIGFLSGDRYSDRSEAVHCRKQLNLDFTQEYYVNSFEEWKEAFINLQDEVDLLIWTAIAGIDDWDKEEALNVIKEHASIPYGTVNDWMMPYVLIGVTKDPEEQGKWAARTALRIHSGTAPSDIPLVKNRHAKIYLNMDIAKQLEITFPMSWVERANLVRAE